MQKNRRGFLGLVNIRTRSQEHSLGAEREKKAAKGRESKR